MKSHKKQILRLLENHGDSLSTKQIRGALGLNKTATAKLKAELLKLIKAGKISKQGTRYFKAQEKPKHAVSKEKRKEAIYGAMDAVAQAAGEESKIAKALFLLKTGMILKEQIMAAQATMQRILSSAAESAVDGAKGFMKAASAAPPPANVPLIAIFAAQAAGIAMSIKSAVSTAKSMVGSKGGGGGMGGAASAPQAPSFNVVGAAPENQLAQVIGQKEDKPIKAFVVSNDVTNAQALDRNIVEGASIG